MAWFNGWSNSATNSCQLSYNTTSATTSTEWTWTSKHCAVSECGEACHKRENCIPLEDPKGDSCSIFCKECGVSSVDTTRLCGKEPDDSTHNDIINYLYETYVEAKVWP